MLSHFWSSRPTMEVPQLWNSDTGAIRTGRQAGRQQGQAGRQAARAGRQAGRQAGRHWQALAGRHSTGRQAGTGKTAALACKQ